MVLRNYIELQPGVPAAMHFASHTMETKDIRDPRTGMVKSLTTLVFLVDRLNGAGTGALFSVTSEKLAKKLEPLLAGERYKGLTITLVKLGTGYLTEYEVQVAPAG